jgi:uncharacterized protein (TIGR03435 family)
MRFVVCATIAVICTSLGAQTVPPASPQFEVASVRPVAKEEIAAGPSQAFRQILRENSQLGSIYMRGDLVSLTNLPLLDLIAIAYSVRTYQVSGPGWLSDLDFDIEAKVPVGTRKEDLNSMLQSLLEERFGLKAHRAVQTAQGFALVVGKDGVKLELATPPPAHVEGLTDEERKARNQQITEEKMAAMRKRYQGGPPVESAWWPSITTEDMASRLVRFTKAPVVDDTGLTGKYSVLIEVSPAPDVPGDTIFDAVEKMGLKLQPRKVTIETVVVEDVSKMPTEN